LESGALQLTRQPGDIQDAIGIALQNLNERLAKRQVLVDVPDKLPLVPMDFVFIVQVLVNLIDNSIKYSPEQTTIEISANVNRQGMLVQVKDMGIGIPADDLQRIFDKFYRVLQPENISGTGLGLSISKGIIEAHGGQIWAENRPEGGTVISFTLPLETSQGKEV